MLFIGLRYDKDFFKIIELLVFLAYELAEMVSVSLFKRA